MPRRLLGLVAAVSIAVGLLGGVSNATGSTASRPTSRPTSRTAQSDLSWHRCGGAQCANLAVPLDDTVKGGRMINIALVQLRARQPSRRLGSLVVNPGGPGASGVDYVLNAAAGLPSELRDRFDIVGFDPRGVGGSIPIDCTRNLDSFYALDWAPANAKQRAKLDAGVEKLVSECKRADGSLLPYVSTVRTARDLDRIRAALGDQKLTYLGYSYGTYLGALYANQFPTRVRALVLDGPVDPALDATKVQVQQAAGFEHSLDLFLHDCAAHQSCAFWNGGHPGRAYDQLRKRIVQSPVPAKQSGKGRVLNATLFDIGVTLVLYQGHAAWGDLASALAAADNGDGSQIVDFADQYTGRSSDGTYDNGEEAFLAIGCADGPPVGNLKQMRVIEELAARAAPRLGRSIVNNSLACATWPVIAPAAAPLHAKGAPPIVVLATRNDPATPLVWGKGLAKQLDSGVLVTVGGERHTAFAAGNSCVDDAVIKYFVNLTVPTNGTRC